MDNFTWTINGFPCFYCGDKDKGMRMLFAEIGDEEVVNFSVLCTHCHVMTILEAPVKKFWDMVNDVPPSETDN